MLESYHVMKLQDFLSSRKFHIEDESKIDEINIEVRDRIESSLVDKGIDRCIGNFGI